MGDPSLGSPSDRTPTPPPPRRSGSVHARRTGRPIKLTPEIQAALCKVVQSGCYLETAAVFVGIGKATLYRWIRLGREGSSKRHREFLDAVNKAMAHAEVRDLLQVQKAAEIHWQAAAWRLERRYPKRWGKRSRDQLVAAASVPSPQETAAKIREFLAAADAMEGISPSAPSPAPPHSESPGAAAHDASPTNSQEVKE